MLDVHLYAGLSITGAVGTVYSMEYVTDLAQANDPSAWRCLEYLQLPASPYLWADKSAPATGQRFYRAQVFGTPANMAFIPPGTFRMGSPPDEVDRSDWEGPQTAVTLTKGFWMGKYEVKQGEYLAVMGSNPSEFTGDTERPVEQVTWYDATNYCAKLTERERAAGRIGTNGVYRLPTEAEWEYACRGWTSTRFSYGDDPGYTNLTNYAWYRHNSGGMTHPVGQKLPNPWGLYDMHGNVWEWCQDWWSGYQRVRFFPAHLISGEALPAKAGTPNPPRLESRLQAVGRPDCQRVRFFPAHLVWAEALPAQAGTPNPPRWESRLQAVGRPDCQRVRFFPAHLIWGEALPAQAGTPNLRRAESYARRYGWFLKMDVRKDFVGYRVFPHELRLTRPPAGSRNAVFRGEPRWNKARCE